MQQAEKSKLQKECGVTAISLANAEALIAEHGRPNLIKLWYDARHWHIVTVEWLDEYKHSFSGFSWGYAGEGPHGLARFAKMIGLERLLTLDMIAGFPCDTLSLSKTLYVFHFAPRTFGGKPEWIR